MRYISVECEYFSAKFVPNPALLSELFLSKAMSFHSGGVDEQGKGQAPLQRSQRDRLQAQQESGSQHFSPHTHQLKQG